MTEIATTSATPETDPPPRGRLFLKYVLSFVGIVSVVLLASGLLDGWFSYRETRQTLALVQHSKAEGAAQRIEQFIAEIERQIGWTTHAQWAAGNIDQRRFDYVRLLRQVPAITELVQIDGQGREKLKVSRLAMDVVDSNTDYSADPRYVEAMKRRIWYSPVYFRKESEPYMTIAIVRAGRQAGVTLAEVNLKLIWDVVTGIRLGQGGYSYVLDGDGRLIAHPDISLVLRNTDLSKLPQVIAARTATDLRTPEERATIVPALDGRSVFSAVAAIPQLSWFVFVETPVNEALGPLYDTMLRTGLLLLLGLCIAALGGVLFARRMLVPVRELAAGAARLGTGDLAIRINVRTGDELQALGDSFNRMAGQLQQSYAGLEQKVADRTHELQETLEYQTATSDVLKAISRTSFDLGAVLDTLVATAMRLCRADMAQFFRLEGNTFRWEAGAGINAAYQELEEKSAISLDRGTLVGRTGVERSPVHVVDSLADPEYTAKEDAKLGGVRTMLGVPLMRDDVLFGVFAIARSRVEAFTPRQIELVAIFADQAVIAMENVRLFREIQDKSRQLELASQHKSQFLANMSHELRTPLNAVLGYAELMADGVYGELGDKAQGVLGRIQANGKHLLGLINDVLDLSKIEAGQFTLAIEPYSVGAIVQAVVAATESLASTKGLKLVPEVAPDLPSGSGDERRLTQVLLNIVGNAIKFTDKGEIVIGARRDGEMFELAVRDTGPGIAPENQAKIFGEFQQVDDSSTRKKGGTGLGLTISKKIVEMHGGAISVESEVGKGSIFHVRIPMRVAIEEAAQ